MDVLLEEPGNITEDALVAEPEECEGTSIFPV
jgi:hypothetical protein